MSSFMNTGRVRLAVLILALTPLLAACGLGAGGTGPTVKRALFSSKEFGVSSSPRVTNNPNPPKGGGRYMVGKPYTVRGKVFTPREDPDYTAQGKASWYGADFHGRLTANGEIFSANAITGAHPTLPIPSYVRVTNLENGRSLMVRINDRGPYLPGRLIDLSHRAADMLGFVNRGSAQVKVDYVAPAPLEGDDTRILTASLTQSVPMQQTTMVAMADSRQIAPQPRPQTNAYATEGSSGAQDGMLGTLSVTALPTELLGYAEARFDPEQEELVINDAHAAVIAMASRAASLDAWRDSIDEDARSIRLQLGVFSDAGTTVELAKAFAMLGAVAQEPVEVGSRSATRLVLTKLKPGVARSDVLNLARELGLEAILLY